MNEIRFPLGDAVAVRPYGAYEHSNLYRFKIYDIPIGDHPGTFGYVRLNHTHEGVDIYADEGTPVVACENGILVGMFPFTGEHAGSPWWENTWSAVVKHDNFYLVYGEIEPETIASNDIRAGQLLGRVKRVLKTDKGRPRSMLHLEMYDRNWNPPECAEWKPKHPKPLHLMDPTGYLLSAAVYNELLRSGYERQ